MQSNFVQTTSLSGDAAKETHIEEWNDFRLYEHIHYLLHVILWVRNCSDYHDSVEQVQWNSMRSYKVVRSSTVLVTKAILADQLNNEHSIIW